MSITCQAPAARASGLRLHRPADDQGRPTPPTRWSILGYPASIHLWSAEEWAALEPKPQDAQPFESGEWCALRVD